MLNICLTIDCSLKIFYTWLNSKISYVNLINKLLKIRVINLLTTWLFTVLKVYEWRWNMLLISLIEISLKGFVFPLNQTFKTFFWHPVCSSSGSQNNNFENTLAFSFFSFTFLNFNYIQLLYLCGCVYVNRFNTIKFVWVLCCWLVCTSRCINWEIS